MFPDNRCLRCSEIGRINPGVAVPVMAIPIVNWPGAPAYLQFKGCLCKSHTLAFTMSDFANHMGDWYDYVSDLLRATRKPAVNPFPNNPSFKWEDFIVNPNFEPVPREQCRLEFWRPETLAAKGGTYTLKPKGS